MKVPKELEAELDATGLPWRLEIGKSHRKIRLAGRLVGILPHGKKQEADRRQLLNTIAQVRRMAKELHNL